MIAKSDMEIWTEGVAAEGRMEDGVLACFGWTEEDMPPLPFKDWWFDWYDASLELVGCKNGLTLTEEQLETVLLHGIIRVFVSDESAELHSNERARMYWYEKGAWKFSEKGCGAMVTKNDRGRGLVQVLRNKLRSRCQNHPAVNAELCQECIDHAIETGSVL